MSIWLHIIERVILGTDRVVVAKLVGDDMESAHLFGLAPLGATRMTPPECAVWYQQFG
ncbi:hypothetical protein Pcac1_g21103 [Phytophthora cactorum]|nr:hypothetical protein Pcac1_g21103 [Phytophthora cactorum]KAG3004063.1 hypothetical protein PC120_g18810 [Phytophthora cactorum]KAG3155121.1 hypothetical protein PC128_g22144 [Phytophthora cactorum]